MASIKKNFSYNILLNISNVLFPIITAPYVARVLGPEACGLAGFAGTYAGYFAMAAGLGSGMYGTREIAKLRDDRAGMERFMSEMISISVIHTVIVSFIYLITLLLIPKMQENFFIFFIAGFSLYLLPFGGLSWYYVGNERFGFTTSRSLILRILTIIALFLFVKNRSDLYIYMMLNVLSGFGVIFSNIYFIRKDGVRLNLTFKGLKRHYKPMLLLFSSTVAISIYTMLDSLMLGIFSTYSEVSFYSNASTLCKALLGVVTSLSAVAVPRVAYYFKNKDYTNINMLMEKSLSMVSFLAVPMAVGIACIAPVFVPLFLGDAYIPAIHPTMIMSGVVIAIGFNNLLGIQILIGLGLDKRFLQCVLVGTVSNFFLNLLVIPLWGASGAAISSVIAEFLILFVEIYFVKKYTLVRFGDGVKDVWKSFAASLIFIPIAIGLSFVFRGWLYVAILVVSCTMLYAFSQRLLRSNSYNLIITTVKGLIPGKK